MRNSTERRFSRRPKRPLRPAGLPTSLARGEQPLEQRDIVRRVLSTDIDGHRVRGHQVTDEHPRDTDGSMSRAATSATDSGV